MIGTMQAASLRIANKGMTEVFRFKKSHKPRNLTINFMVYGFFIAEVSFVVYTHYNSLVVYTC